MKFIELITDPLLFSVFVSIGLTWWLLIIYFTKKGNDREKIGNYLYLSVFFHVVFLLISLAIVKNFTLDSKNVLLKLLPNYYQYLFNPSKYIFIAWLIPFFYAFLFIVGIVAPIIILYEAIVSEDDPNKIEIIYHKLIFNSKIPSFISSIWFFLGSFIIIIFFLLFAGSFFALHDKIKEIIVFGF